jgi:hypothetical protein
MAFVSEESNSTPSPAKRSGASVSNAPRKKLNTHKRELRGVPTPVPLGSGAEGKNGGPDEGEPKEPPCMCCGFLPGSHY